MKKPTTDEIYEYMLEREFDNFEEAESFFDHFESNGWRVGKNPMKCYKAAIRTWIRNAKKWGRTNEQAQRHQSSHQSFADRQRQAAAEAMQELEQRDRETSLRLVR